jgi:hypothetical protein
MHRSLYETGGRGGGANGNSGKCKEKFGLSDQKIC